MILGAYIFLLLVLLWKRYQVIDYFEEVNCQRYLEILNKDYASFRKSRFVFTLISLAICFLISFKFSYLSLLLLMLLFKFPYLKIKREVKNLSQQISYEFPIWLRQIQCLIQSNTVLNSLAMTVDESPDLMKPYLKDLIESLRHNPSDLKTYQNFMALYDNWEIQNAMQHLYRYNYLSNESSYDQLSMFNESTSSWLRKSRNERYESFIKSHTFLAFLPMLAVTFLFIVLMSLLMKGMLEGGWVN